MVRDFIGRNFKILTFHLIIPTLTPLGVRTYHKLAAGLGTRLRFSPSTQLYSVEQSWSRHRLAVSSADSTTLRRSSPRRKLPLPSRSKKLLRLFFAAGLGLEPRYSPPEGEVLPLDDPAIYLFILLHSPCSVQYFLACARQH